MVLLLTETLEDFDLKNEDVEAVKDEILSRSRYVITR